MNATVAIASVCHRGQAGFDVDRRFVDAKALGEGEEWVVRACAVAPVTLAMDDRLRILEPGLEFFAGVERFRSAGELAHRNRVAILRICGPGQPHQVASVSSRAIAGEMVGEQSL